MQFLGRKWQKKNNSKGKGNKISGLRFNFAWAPFRIRQSGDAIGESKAQFGLAKF
jgi:hypothetical protein